MRPIVPFLTVLAALSPAVAQAEWQAVEQVKPYTVTGSTGAALYDSIGARGPKLGLGRVIAHTTFKLTWTRKYERQGNACAITTARPNLTIIYTLPKASGTMPAAVRASWEHFIEGVAAHEREHGDFIRDMVRDIQATSLGLTVPDDPDCRLIRTELTQRLGELSNRQRQRSRDFDRVELGNGGNVHQLILGLVNGP